MLAIIAPFHPLDPLRQMMEQRLVAPTAARHRQAVEKLDRDHQVSIVVEDDFL